MCRTLALALGQKTVVQVFWPQMMEVTDVTIVPRRIDTLLIGTERYACFVCDVTPIREVFYIAEDGKLVGIDDHAQNLEIRLRCKSSEP
ncbi:hypothetical protein ACFLQW_02700 [Candidatus Zixiibacteriota bacterium]